MSSPFSYLSIHTACFLESGYTFPLAGGYLAHSLAIMTDAAHLLADIGSMLASLFSLWLSSLIKCMPEQAHNQMLKSVGSGLGVMVAEALSL